MMLNLIDSHDTHRFFTEVSKDKDKLLCALALEIIVPGAPCIYYGTEICMEGGYDPDSRRCFNWKQENWDREVMRTIKELTALRADSVLQYGKVNLREEDEMLCVERIWEERKIVLYINLSKREKQVSLSEDQKVMSSHRYDRELENNGFLVVMGQEI